MALLGLIGSIPAAAQLLTSAERPVASIVSLITVLVFAGYLGWGSARSSPHGAEVPR